MSNPNQANDLTLFAGCSGATLEPRSQPMPLPCGPGGIVSCLAVMDLGGSGLAPWLDQVYQYFESFRYLPHIAVHGHGRSSSITTWLRAMLAILYSAFAIVHAMKP